MPDISIITEKALSRIPSLPHPATRRAIRQNVEKQFAPKSVQLVVCNDCMTRPVEPFRKKCLPCVAIYTKRTSERDRRENFARRLSFAVALLCGFLIIGGWYFLTSGAPKF